MPYKTIIAEKPSVAASIARIVGAKEPHRDGPCGYLEGGGYRVTWAFGHLVGLLSPEQMGFDKAALPMFPDKWETKIKGKRDASGKEQSDPMTNKQMKTLESLFKGSSLIIVATDAGREGELIFRYIYEYLGCKTPFQRLWISSLTDEAIRKGLNEVKDGHEYDSLSDAAHARSQADWLVGYNASKALRLSTGFRGTVSLGRVQTPTLGMICQRYEQNKNFVPVPYWQISVLTCKDSSEFSALSEKKFDSENEAQAALSQTKAANALTVQSVDKKRTSTKPPLLYDLTALQRAANGKYGMTASDTLKAAQSLYEKKLLSYPRTGSRYIPEDVYKTLPSLIAGFSSYGKFGSCAAALSGKSLCKKSVDDSKVTDHHALLPTGNLSSELTGWEQKVYDLVVGRMLESFGEDFVADVTSVSLNGGGVIYKTRGSVPVSLGWKGVYGADSQEESKQDKEKDQEDERQDNQELPQLTKGETLPLRDAESLRKETKPLPIFTDSSLLGEMETCGKRIDDETMREAMKDVGLGTPATRAAIIEALLQRNYVCRDSKKLVPTEFGLQIWKMVRGRKISDVTTTGEWERDLSLVERGQMPVQKFSSGIKSFVQDIIDDLRKNCVPLEGVSPTGEPQRKCPLCGGQMKNMKFNIVCENPDCLCKIPREVASKKLSSSAIEALCKGKETGLIKGFTSKSGKKFDAKLCLDKERRSVVFDFGTPPDKASSVEHIEGLVCPLCGGTLEDKGAKIECGCGFVLWKKTCGVQMTPSQVKAILSGETIQLYGLVSKAGKKFNAGVRLDKEKKGTEFVFGKK